MNRAILPIIAVAAIVAAARVDAASVLFNEPQQPPTSGGIVLEYNILYPYLLSVIRLIVY